MKNLFLFFAISLFAAMPVFAQVGINADNSQPDPSAMLDVKSPVKGLLAPRVALTSTSEAVPVDSPATGLLVYNTAAAGTPPNEVLPGYYRWNGSKWVRIEAPEGVNLGDMQYWNGTQWITVPVGLPGQYLQLSQGSIPSWTGSAFASITTMAISNITANSAGSGGIISSDGGSAITAKGICYHTAPNPTTANPKIASGTGTGSFSANITGLSANTTYYVRAYATNAAGTAYGNELTFNTLPIIFVPTVFTSPVTAIGSVTAICGGTVTNNGGGAVTARGVCWSTSPNPTIAANYTVNGSGNGGFSSNLTGLTPNTTYYVRAYATNSAGTGYGNEMSFNTLCASYTAAGVAITSGANPVCSGTNVIFTATSSNGGTAPVYQWKVNGNSISGATGTSFSYIPSDGDAVVCVMTSNQICVNGNPATSNVIPMTVIPILPVSISISASANPVNFGVPVTLTANPVNGGDHPVFTWKINGTVVGSDTNVYTYFPANQDTAVCIVQSDLPCSTGSPATSGILVIGVSPNNTPCPGLATVEYGGQIYHTIQIGDQCWLKENLNIGTRIDGTVAQSNNTVIEKYCYNNTEDSCTVYGGLYQWNEMMQYATTPGAQGICPSGWHIPADAEWSALVNYLGGSSQAGKKLKEAGTVHWQSPNTDADNLSGFTALGGGYRRGDNGQFASILTGGHFYSSTDTNTSQVWKRFMAWDLAAVQRNANVKSNGFSVRCIKDCYSGCSFSCGQALYVNHTAGVVAPVSKTTRYSTVTGLPGEPAKCWISSNLGSTRQATAQSDNTESSAGWYWQFNRKQGFKHDGALLTPAWTITGIFENSNWIPLNDPCTTELGTPWRIPTYSEFNNLNNSGLWINWNEPWNSPLKLHAAGCLGYAAGSLYSRGSSGYYWTTEPSGNNNAWGYTAYSGGSLMNVYNKAYGFPLRCVRE